MGLGRLELPTSPLSGVRSSHLSYRPNANEVWLRYSPFSLRRVRMVRNCVQLLFVRQFSRRQVLSRAFTPRRQECLRHRAHTAKSGCAAKDGPSELIEAVEGGYFVGFG